MVGVYRLGKSQTVDHSDALGLVLALSQSAPSPFNDPPLLTGGGAYDSQKFGNFSH